MITSNTFHDGTTGIARGNEMVFRGVGLAGAFAEYAQAAPRARSRSERRPASTSRA
jgi:hypothetical protein